MVEWQNKIVSFIMSYSGVKVLKRTMHWGNFHGIYYSLRSRINILVLLLSPPNDMFVLEHAGNNGDKAYDEYVVDFWDKHISNKRNA